MLPPAASQGNCSQMGPCPTLGHPKVLILDKSKRSVLNRRVTSREVLLEEEEVVFGSFFHSLIKRSLPYLVQISLSSFAKAVHPGDS